MEPPLIGYVYEKIHSFIKIIIYHHNTGWNIPVWTYNELRQ